MDIKSRLPKTDEIFYVYSLVVFLEYTFALFALFYNLPRWILDLSVWEIAVAFFYGISFTLLDSVSFFLFMLIITMILPRDWILSEFMSRGSMFVCASFVWMVMLQIGFSPDTLDTFFLLLLIAAFHVPTMVFMVKRMGWLKSAMEQLAQRTVIFSYIYLPLSAIGIVVVIARNLF